MSHEALAAWSWCSGIVSACRRGDWSFGSWDRIPPGFSGGSFKKNENITVVLRFDTSMYVWCLQFSQNLSVMFYVNVWSVWCIHIRYNYSVRNYCLKLPPKCRFINSTPGNFITTFLHSQNCFFPSWFNNLLANECPENRIARRARCRQWQQSVNFYRWGLHVGTCTCWLSFLRVQTLKYYPVLRMSPYAM
jgi:hypothetical protein